MKRKANTINFTRGLLNLNRDNLCRLCPNDCKVDRTITSGVCHAKSDIRIAKYYLHPYEEPCISGKNGSGTIFFTGCSLGCVFCQNYELSRNLRGKDISILELADIFKKLEDQGAHNINLVSPTVYSDKIVKALDVYKPNVPVVYNTHGYEKPEIIEKLNDYVDVYLPDMKFFSETLSMRYTGKKDYFKVASRAIELMANKPLIFDENGLIKSGVIVRHLVLPQCTSDSIKILDWFSDSLLKDKAYINVMSQYTPFGDIENFPELKRKLTRREYDKVIDYAISKNIDKMYYQKFESVCTEYIPKWDF